MRGTSGNSRDPGRVDWGQREDSREHEGRELGWPGEDLGDFSKCNFFLCV